jgi:hypothetical protein
MIRVESHVMRWSTTSSAKFGPHAIKYLPAGQTSAQPTALHSRLKGRKLRNERSAGDGLNALTARCKVLDDAVAVFHRVARSRLWWLIAMAFLSGAAVGMGN